GYLSIAQTFSGTGGTIPPGPSTTQTCFPLTITGVGTINSTYGLSGVCFTITHPNVDELEITLTAPDGTVIPLSIQNGGTGNNYTNTCFSATSTNPIKFGTAPFTGTYSPEGHMGAVNNGQNANGIWRLCIQDQRTASNSGVLNNWNLTFNNTPAPPPPNFPTCSNTLLPGSACATATPICDFNGVCGSTTGSSLQTWAQLTAAACFGLQNNFFVKFTASATTASFSVWVPTSSGGYPGGGIQMLFFSGTCGGAVTGHGCYRHLLPYNTPGTPLIHVVSASGLTPGNIYYLMIDGYNGDIATFRIAANSGVNILDINPPSASICNGQSVNLTASGGNGVYAWSPATALSATAGATVTSSATTTTTYTVTTTSSGGCPITKDVTVTVNDRPSVTVEPTTVNQTVCQNETPTGYTLTAIPGSGTISGYQWYSNAVNTNSGGTLIGSATTTTLTPSTSTIGTFYYYCVVTNSNGCRDTSAVSGSLTVTPTVGTPAFTLGATSTRCQAAGSVTYGATAANTTGITYTLDAASLAAGNTINATTGEVTYVAGWAGAAIITASAAGCAVPVTAIHTATTTAIITPVTTFSYSSPVCATGINPVPITAPGFTPGGTFSSTLGLSINGTTGVINLPTSSQGTYTVTYTVPADAATCRLASTSTATITINNVITPVTSFSYTSPVCANGTNPTPILAAGFTTGGTFSAPAGVTINATSGIIDLATTTPGT
ncbi:MAG: proprotein convertase P-domain-containing protein, partial [Ferruginibacter sp.]